MTTDPRVEAVAAGLQAWANELSKILQHGVPAPSDAVIRTLLAAADAARPLPAGVDRMRFALQSIHDTFTRDIEQGYRTKDKEYAISMATLGLAADAARPVPRDVAGLVERLNRRWGLNDGLSAKVLHDLLHAERDEAAAALTALAEEKDRYLRHLTAGAESIRDATARAETAERKLAVATEALKPFADDAVELADAISDDTCLSYDGHADIGFADFTVGDLRRARAALAESLSGGAEVVGACPKCKGVDDVPD